ncbi:MAG: flagellar hook-associated protein FlgL [Planctomycetaceae bacterium]|nr:flagellar hook-associated protein FlgL [Planctomycetaceae bacterium]
MSIFRVTPNVSIAQFLSQLTSHTRRVSDLQQQATTGLRIQRPSDDPSGLRFVLRAEEAITRLETHSTAINSSRQVVDQAHIAVREAHQMFVQAGILATEAVQATDPSEQAVIADEVNSLLAQLEVLANTRVADEYVFAGIDSGTAPFAFSATPDGASYYGSDVARTLTLPGGPPILLLQTGADVFQPQSRGTTIIVGNTGAAAGTATDNGRGQATLAVRHTLTTFAAGSGVAAGVDSAADDTIIGPSGLHALTINDTSGTGTSGTVSLNGGPPVAFTNTDTNLQVIGPEGEIVHVDTTGITPGFSGDVAITASGTLSTDGGTTQTTIDYSGNQAVTNSLTGEITNLDSSNVRRTGDDSLEYAGTSDAFAALKELRDDIRNLRELPESDRQAALGRRLTEVNRIKDHLLDVVGQQSVTLAHLDDVQTHLEDTQLEFRKQVSETASADITQVALQLQQAQLQLQYTLATASRLFDVSLLDFLR